MLSKLALSFCCSSNTDAVHIAIGEIVQLNEPSPGRRTSAPHLEITVEMSFGRILTTDFLYIAPATETRLPRRLSQVSPSFVVALERVQYAENLAKGFVSLDIYPGQYKVHLMRIQRERSFVEAVGSSAAFTISKITEKDQYSSSDEEDESVGHRRRGSNVGSRAYHVRSGSDSSSISLTQFAGSSIASPVYPSAYKSGIPHEIAKLQKA